MKGFEWKNQLFSLCGLNCGLCPMLLGNYCGGCGNGNQSCKIARCSLEHGKIEYCYECKQYPCEKYQNMDEYDSFITGRRRIADIERAQNIGIEQYNLEQQEKVQILSYLLSNYNDGRRKNFFCVAVNLLELSEIKEASTAGNFFRCFLNVQRRAKEFVACATCPRAASRENLPYSIMV